MRILIVDDNRTSLLTLVKLAARLDGCEALPFSSPQDALALMPDIDFDIAVVDFNMPVYNGVEFITEIMRFEKYKDKMVVIVTADTDLATRMAALNAGAIDFLTKPVNTMEFRARLKNLVALTDAQKKLADNAAWLSREVDKSVGQIRQREEEIIHRLTMAASYKDSETASHTMRVGAYSEAIARAYGLDETLCADIRLAAPMHDIGKVAIPDSVLLKDGKLTETEFAEMQRHTLVGESILKESASSLLQLAAEIAGSHHERWDGQGYPMRQARDNIPLSGRIVAIADSFDALTTARPYKQAWSLEDSVAYICDAAGTQFDPACVDAFIVALPEITATMRSATNGAFAPAACGTTAAAANAA